MDTTQLNPYTKAMVNCLVQYEETETPPSLDDTTNQFLANMIQGRFLHYLANRICHNYDISDRELEKRLTLTLTRILSDKFFAVFREKVREKPEIVYELARKITNMEMNEHISSSRLDAFFWGISRKYFKYRDSRTIMRWIDTNPEIERIVFISRVRKHIEDSSLLKALMYIVQNDRDGIAPAVFNRYLNKNKLGRLGNIVRTGDWKIEAMFVQQQLAKLINWRNYINSIQ